MLAEVPAVGRRRLASVHEEDLALGDGPTALARWEACGHGGHARMLLQCRFHRQGNTARE